MAAVPVGLVLLFVYGLIAPSPETVRGLPVAERHGCRSGISEGWHAGFVSAPIRPEST